MNISIQNIQSPTFKRNDMKEYSCFHIIYQKCKMKELTNYLKFVKKALIEVFF